MKKTWVVGYLWSLMITALVLSGCGKGEPTLDDKTAFSYEDARFRVVEAFPIYEYSIDGDRGKLSHVVMQDQETGCRYLYAKSHSGGGTGVTALLKKDGTPDCEDN